MKINKIFLMMGHLCNFQCKYCLQEPVKLDIDNIDSSYLSKDLYNYIDNLIEDLSYNNDYTLSVVFWGGEPLLYWKIIKEFVLHYGDKLKYVIISNGSLLTQDKVDFLKEHCISFVLSHDGKETVKTRGVDVLQRDDILDLVGQIPHITLNSVISSYNQDYNELFNYWGEKYPNFVGNVEMLRVTWNMPKDLIDIDFDIFRKGLKNLFRDSIEKLKKCKYDNKTIEAEKIVRSVCRSVKNKRFHFPKCYQVEKVLNVDLDGNIYVCHNSNVKIGNIKDDRIQYLNRYKDWIELKKKRKCDDCDIKYFCQGGCPLDITDDTCKLQRILYEEAIISYEQNKDLWDRRLGEYI